MTEQHRPTVVICGATAGVGLATAHHFAAAGYGVGLIARSEQGLTLTEQALRAYGVPIHAISMDVADAQGMLEAAQRLETELGPIDVWINSAMATVFAPIQQLTPEEIRRVTEVTYLGAVHGTLAALALMRPRNRGLIIQVGSALAYRPLPLQAPYCAAKFATRGFTDALRCELHHEHSEIKLCMVQLPAIDTPQFEWARNKLAKRARPVAPIHDPQVAARAIFSVVRRPPRELWLGMTTITAIIGSTLIPGLLDAMLSRKAWNGQMSQERDDRERPDNLYQPVEGLHQARGRFGHESRKAALALSASHVLALATIALVLLILVLL